MRRSELNRILGEAAAFISNMNYKLPPFAFWSPADWQDKGHEYDEIRENMLGWDVTDFGSGDFNKTGLLLFTVRNGHFQNESNGKPYAEKIMIVREGQITPYHFHFNKMEDIINRGGGNLLIQLYNASPEGAFAATPVQVSQDGRNYQVPAGSVIRLTPGESITLPTGQYHQFWGEPGFGPILVGEVSKVNDDRIDNRFYEPAGRFPTIIEDVEPLYLLVNDYPPAR